MNNITYTMLNYTYGTNGMPVPQGKEYLVNVWTTNLEINDPTKDTAYQTYKEQNIIAGGMIPKLHNSFNAIDEGVSEVLIMHASNILTQKGTRLISSHETGAK